MSDREALSTRVTLAEQRINENTNVVKEADENGGWRMRIPGFKYDDFNRAGLMSIVQMDRLSMPCATIKIDDQSPPLGLLFTVGRHWTFSERLYEQAAINFPMIVHCHLTGVGNASYDQQIHFYEDKSSATKTSAVTAIDHEPLATCVIRLVNVDRVTRKTAPLPDLFTSAARKVLFPDGQRFPSLRPPTIIPDHNYCCRLQVRYDDTDFYAHTNVSSYLGFVLECASMAAKAGFYSAINDDVAFFRAKKATSTFISESRVGDDLDVVTWEDSENPMLVNFVAKKTEKLSTSLSSSITITVWYRIHNFELRSSQRHSAKI